MSSAITHTERVAELNDRFRQSLEIPVLGVATIPGLVVMSAGVASLDPMHQIEIIASVRRFDAFTPDNDPYGEHDFASISHPVAGKLFWKISYYEGQDMQYGAPDPADLSNCFRVLTIMLAHEY